MTQPAKEKPFPYPIDPNYGMLNPDSLPIFMIRMIHSMIEKDQAQSLYDKYLKAFKISVDAFRKQNVIAFDNNTIILIGLGFRKEVEARSKQDSLSKVLKFKDWMLVAKTDYERRRDLLEPNA